MCKGVGKLDIHVHNIAIHSLSAGFRFSPRQHNLVSAMCKQGGAKSAVQVMRLVVAKQLERYTYIDKLIKAY